MVTLGDAEVLFKIARKSINKTKYRGKIPVNLKKHGGAFVTLLTYPNKELRGCIGYSEAVFPLNVVVEKAAFAAAYYDSRFSPLKESEFNKILVEISILTKPKLIGVKKAEEYLDKICSKDGLIIEYYNNKGLFLPQVWEQIPDKEEFLDNLCMKAGLPPGYWKHKDVMIYKFNVVSFIEKKPNGKIEETNLF